MTIQQQNYNYCHSAARMPAKRSIGLLKIKERSILETLMMYKTQSISQFVVALCVIHNINIEKQNLQYIPLVRLVNDFPNGDLKKEQGIQKRLTIMADLPLRVN